MIIIAFITGLAAGAGLTALFMHLRNRDKNDIIENLRETLESERRADREQVLSQLSDSFGSLSLKALNQNMEQFFTMAHEKFSSERGMHGKELESKKELIDAQIVKINTELEKVSGLVRTFEKDREQKFGELTRYLKVTGEKTTELISTTNALREVLADSRSRGQWGERMAEDILRLAGFREKVNYIKQTATTGTGTIPDFTFMLPRGLTVNMDVKFPFDNYVRYVDADTDADRDRFVRAFLRDVRQKLKDVTTRGYIAPEHNTVDYMLLFIPNEQIYAFIQEQDREILDDSLRQHVILCSPATLFAVLAVIRAAVDNFVLEQTSREILTLLSTFSSQWEKYQSSVDKLGRHLDSVNNEYQNLSSTRRRGMERILDKIEERKSRAIQDVDGDTAGLLPE